MLDHLVAGGINVLDLSPAQNVYREAWEEAGITEDLSKHAVPVG